VRTRAPGGRNGDASSGDIELLDVEPAATESNEQITTGSTHRVGAAIAMAIGIVAAVAVIGVGNDSTPPVDNPDLTEDANQDPPTTERPRIESQQAEAFSGVALGDGPGLVWQRVRVDTDPRYWGWNDGSFVSDNGETEWRIELDEFGPTVSERTSPLIDYPGYSLQGFDGGRLLVPDDPIPDHLIVVSDDRGATRLDIPPLVEPSPSGLTTATIWFYGTSIGDQLVVRQSGFSEVAMSALEERTERDLTGVAHIGVSFNQIDLYPSGQGPLPEPILFTDIGLSDAEVDELRNIGQFSPEVLTASLETGALQRVDFSDYQRSHDLLIGLDGELLLGWTDGGGRSWLSSTTDGLTWSNQRRGVARWMVNSGTQLFDFSNQGSSISRSTDNSETWNITPAPIAEAALTVAGDVVVVGESWDGLDDETSGILVDTGSDQFTLSLFENGRRFELRGPAPFAEPLLGWTYDPASGATWEWATNELVFSNPRTGDELIRVPGHAVESAIAAQHPMTQMAMARWPADDRHPEWLITSPVEVFGEGSLTADFVPGEEYLLAIITTADGYELYITDTTLP